jgi:hypothetical protein
MQHTAVMKAFDLPRTAGVSTKSERRSLDLPYFTVCSTPTFFNTSGGGPSKVNKGVFPT